MPHPEHAVDPLTGSTDGLALFERALARAPTRGVSAAAARPIRHRELGLTDAEYERIVELHGPRAQRRRAGDVLAALVRALRLQALAQAAAAAADRGRAGGDGPRRERRRRRRRRRLRGRLQGRVPQPPERGRALPGSGHRGRRDPARRLRARRAADRGARLAALRRARLGALALPARRRGAPGSATTATRSGCRRSAARSTSRRPTSTTAWSTRCASGSPAAERDGPRGGGRGRQR